MTVVSQTWKPLPLTVPPATGEAEAVSLQYRTIALNVAVTVLSLVIVTVQTLPLTELQPDQLAKR